MAGVCKVMNKLKDTWPLWASGIGIVAILSFWVVVGWVAVHFITKFW